MKPINTATACLWWLSALAIGTMPIAAQSFPNPVQPLNIIIDSDMAHDVDDVGDHAMLWAMAARGEANVLAIIISSTNDYSAACAHAVASYYGHPNVPIGVNHSNIPNDYDSYFSYYTQQVAQRFGFPGDTRAYYPDSTPVYRRALAAAADHSVYIISAGYYKPMVDLLQSSGDSISPLTGVQLVSQKVSWLIPVAGSFPDSGSTDRGNLLIDPDSASYLIANWPTPIVWMPDTEAWDVITGPAASEDPDTNPVKYAYDVYCASAGCNPPDTTPGWTQNALMLAIRGGVGTTFSVGGQNGSTVVWDSSTSIPGRVIWSQSPNRQHAYVLKAIDGATMSTSGTALPITLTASDPQGAPLTYTIATQPSHGSLTGTAPNLTYTPAAGYVGSDSFTFWASNGVYQSNIATVTITVASGYQPPVANSQSLTTNGSPIPITLTATDANSNPLTYAIVTPPAHGTLTGHAPSVAYTPASGYSGTDSFTFQANDGVANSNVATVTIVVNPSIPQYSLRVNAGGPSLTDTAGHAWQADTGYDGGSTFSTTAAISASTGDARLYQTERYASNTLNYTFSNLPYGAYTVNLYFAEIYSGCFYVGCRVFNVLVQGTTILQNFDVYATAGAGNVGVVRSTTATVTNGTLTLTFQASLTQYPVISAIEIVQQVANSSQYGSISGTVFQAGTTTPIVGASVSTTIGSTITDTSGQYILTQVPPGTYPITASSPGYQSITQNATVVAGATTTANLGLSSAPYALRVNAGGPSITDTNGNLWQADTGFSGGYVFSTTSPITATTGDPRLYQTEHYTSGPLQYTFSDLPDGTYHINLYFAEIYSGCFYAGCRVFDIAVQGTTVWTNFDPYAAAGGGNIGVVRSTTAVVTAGTLTITFQAPYTQYPTISAIEAIRQ